MQVFNNIDNSSESAFVDRVRQSIDSGNGFLTIEEFADWLGFKYRQNPWAKFLFNWNPLKDMIVTDEVLKLWGYNPPDMPAFVGLLKLNNFSYEVRSNGHVVLSGFDLFTVGMIHIQTSVTFEMRNIFLAFQKLHFYYSKYRNIRNMVVQEKLHHAFRLSEFNHGDTSDEISALSQQSNTSSRVSVSTSNHLEANLPSSSGLEVSGETSDKSFPLEITDKSPSLKTTVKSTPLNTTTEKSFSLEATTDKSFPLENTTDKSSLKTRNKSSPLKSAGKSFTDTIGTNDSLSDKSDESYLPSLSRMDNINISNDMHISSSKPTESMVFIDSKRKLISSNSSEHDSDDASSASSSTIVNTRQKRRKLTKHAQRLKRKRIYKNQVHWKKLPRILYILETPKETIVFLTPKLNFEEDLKKKYPLGKIKKPLQYKITMLELEMIETFFKDDPQTGVRFDLSRNQILLGPVMKPDKLSKIIHLWHLHKFSEAKELKNVIAEQYQQYCEDS